MITKQGNWKGIFPLWISRYYCQTAVFFCQFSSNRRFESLIMSEICLFGHLGIVQKKFTHVLWIRFKLQRLFFLHNWKVQTKSENGLGISQRCLGVFPIWQDLFLCVGRFALRSKSFDYSIDIFWVNSCRCNESTKGIPFKVRKLAPMRLSTCQGAEGPFWLFANLPLLNLWIISLCEQTCTDI